MPFSSYHSSPLYLVRSAGEAATADHALIEAIKMNDTPAAIALLNAGADSNATDKPYQPMTPKSLLANFGTGEGEQITGG